ncbi:nuclear transport factor 2 family protein [Sphingobium sp. BS19]|uniref:nuclear transport factor 2 family protein n=1 Tax=Sphingobium sp. BS19 TaxID=3018973 RepID=UPI0022EF11B6|nr:nuclear transport factor 2 family protein [Sphingobium sp. BS19]GLJ00724.1 hypothetical protein Sbs19_45450 [Sphingobium sp. BS19]
MKLDGESGDNAVLARVMMETFGPSMSPSWFDNLDDQVVLELPYGPSIGIPERIEGKDAARAMFQSVIDSFGLRFTDIEIFEMLDPSMVVVTYRGSGSAGDHPYNQRYVCLLKFREGRLLFYREYFDNKVLADIMAHVNLS